MCVMIQNDKKIKKKCNEVFYAVNRNVVHNFMHFFLYIKPTTFYIYC